MYMYIPTVIHHMLLVFEMLLLAVVARVVYRRSEHQMLFEDVRKNSVATVASPTTENDVGSLLLLSMLSNFFVLVVIRCATDFLFVCLFFSFLMQAISWSLQTVWKPE